jgi:hypothetical protein
MVQAQSDFVGFVHQPFNYEITTEYAMAKTKTLKRFMEEVSGRPFDVISLYAPGTQYMRFRCKVDGTEWNSTAGNILRGQGCPECGRISRNNKNRKPNLIIEDHGTWVLIDTSTTKFKNATSKIDRIDFNKLNSIGRIHSTGSYPVYSDNCEQKLVHRFVMNNCTEIDHINRDKTDNRRSNLRKCTSSQNSMNSSFSSANKSGTTGVIKIKTNGLWRAFIGLNRKQKFLGEYINKQDAINARLRAEIKYFGEFSANYKLGAII